MNENRNMVLALALSALVILGWSLVSERFFPTPKPAATKVENGKAAPAPAAAPPPSRQKLSFKQKHALDTLPKQISKLEAEIARLNGTLADPALYARDPKRFADTGAALEQAQAALSEAEDQWLELETLREEIEG